MKRYLFFNQKFEVSSILKTFLFSFFFLSFGNVWGQTTLISPTVNNGGFESDLTGWTTVQSDIGKGAWYSGTATSYAGTKSAYISNNTGTTNAYTGDAIRVQHLYRAVTFPAGETSINLSFYWKANGEGASNDWDNLKVYVSNTIPTAGTENLASDRVGLNWYNLQTTWQNASITLPASLAGTTRYLIFQWKHDVSGTYNPPASIDNITLTSQALTTYCTPTQGTANIVDSVTNVTITNSQSGTYSNPTSGNSGYINVNNLPAFALVRSSTTNTIAISFGTDTTQWSAVWIDFNQNGVFEATEAIGMTTSATSGVGPRTYTFTVPAVALLGQTKLRVRGGADGTTNPYNVANGACINTGYGDSEDYNVTIVAPSATPVLAITGTTAHGSVCPGSVATSQTYTITNTGTSAANGITVVSSDPQFVVSGLSSTTIAGSGGTATYNVTFTPSSTGSKTATITVASTTSGSNSPTSSLTGTGTASVTASVATGVATLVTTSTATLNASASTFGVCPNTTAKGFVISQTGLNNNPIIGGSNVTNETIAALGTAGAFNKPITSLLPGTSYSYKAYLYDGTTYTYGAVQTFTTLSPPANDLCSNATAITVNDPAISGTMLNATTTSGIDSYIDVWYQFTPSCIGRYTISVGGFSGDIDVSYFTSCASTSPVQSANSNANPEVLTTTSSLSASTTYYIRVRAFNVAAQSSTFTISVNNQIAIATHPANQTVTVGATATFASSMPANATGYQWQVNTGSGWANVTGGTTNATGNQYTTPATTLAMNGYQYRVIISNGTCNSVTSNVATLTVNTCTPTSSNTSDYISGFSTTGGVSNISNTPTTLSGTGYGNFYTTHFASQYPGSALNFTETYAGGNHGLSIWVDFNNNGIFETSERLFNAGSIAAGFTGSITIPLETSAGDYRMRIRAWWNNLNPDPCTTISFGEAEDYKLTVLALTPCSGTPNAGTALVNGVANVSVNVNAGLSLSASGLSTGSGLSYQWYSSPSGTTWTVIPGATTETYATTAVATETTTYYRLTTTCTASGLTNNSSNATVVTSLPYCVPSTESPSLTYINRVSFLGTLNDVTNTSTYSTSPSGYQNFTGLANKALQIQQESINVYVEANNGSRVKAWVDWNRDGDFVDAGETIFDSEIGLSSTTFGFVVPATATAGDYRIRIRNYTYYDDSILDYNYDYNFNSCEPFLNTYDEEGEAEDYLFTVIARCPADIETVTKGERCGAGSVTLQASTLSAGITEFRWYTTPTGGTPLTSANSGGSTTFNTPSISTTTTYYVAAFNGTCETQVRRAVVATVKDIPEITFSPSALVACGNTTPIEVQAKEGLETVYLVDENFDVGSLASSAFANTNIVNNSATINQITRWESKASPFVPSDGQDSWLPAISSGYGTNKFVFSTSDVGSGYTIDHGLVMRNAINTTDFQNLTMKFRMYFSRYTSDNVAPNSEYVSVEVSTDGGTTYAPLATPRTYIADVGSPGNFATETVDLSAYINQTNLKFRIRYYSNGWRDGVAVDDIQIYGSKTLTASYAWSGSDISVFTDAAMQTPYVTGTPVDKVYIVPNTSILVQPSFNINITTTLTNGCPLVQVIPFTNDSKVWDVASSTDWTTPNWQPGNAAPTADKCVIVRTPVNIPSSINGLAKNIKIENGGSLNIESGASLTLTDAVVNQATASDFVVKSDANLLQINNVANKGPVKVERSVVNMNNQATGAGAQVDYVYWSSPVFEQLIKGASGFSPNTPSTGYQQYNEVNDRFVTTPDTYFQAGKGYSIRAENVLANGYNKTYSFAGVPNNGNISTPLLGKSAGTDKGYNLVGNPYPSNMDFDAFYALNSSKMYNTAWFWTNVTYTATQMGSDYKGNNYAVYNGTGGVAPAYDWADYDPEDPSGITPNGKVKVGQGFIVQVKTPAVLDFNNGMRVTDNGTFYQKGAAKNRFWLTMRSPKNMVNTILVGYIPEATNGFETDFDGELFVVGSDSFYSVLGSKKLAIQGKDGNFSNEDVVTLGNAFSVDGTYTIGLQTPEGIFNDGQNIYLRDKLLNKYINLSTEKSYIFSAVKGADATRFEIVYKESSVLGNDETAKSDFVVYRDKNTFIVKSSKKLGRVDIYDTGGRLVRQLSSKENSLTIDATGLPNSIYIIKAENSGDIQTKKIIK